MDDQTDEQYIEENTDAMIPLDPQALGIAVNHIPAPILNNAVRAFTRLCTAAVEYPASLIENEIAEKRAESAARVRLINTSGQQISQQMRTDPEYARAAVEKFGQKILRERVNLDQIAQMAAEELGSENVPQAKSDEPESAPISEDWMNVFESEAAQMSSEQMQRIFSRILAGEIRKPSSYSIRTIRLLAQLDNTAAILFRTLCSLSISLRIPNADVLVDARVVSLGNANTNSLQPYGLNFGQLNILQEYGLIIPDYNSWMDYRPAIAVDNKVILPATYLNELWAFVPTGGATPEPDFRLAGVALSRAGKELLSVVEPTPNTQYTEALKKHLQSRGVVLVKMGDTNPSPGA